MRHSERGIALVVTLFALLLLTVIGLGMMFSTNMETMINNNYRDKQVAIYASMSGLQEARDRLQLANPDIPVPTELPSLTNGGVIYIINPKGSEVIQPWNTSNDYFDTELCQENVLDLSGTRGVPCTATASGNTWYTVVDNSDGTNSPWGLSAPLDVKWTRVTVKGNNMAAVSVNGDDTDSDIVCYDGINQIVSPAGYGPTCNPDGSIASLTLTSAGSGYTSQPSVTIQASPTGDTATAEVNFTTLSTGEISSITINTPGDNYTSAPQVVITDANGSGASAVATIVATGGSVTSLTFGGGGTKCYAATPTVAISGGGGSGATASVTLGADTCIASWTPSGSCNPRDGTTVAVQATNGGGTGFAGSITFRNGNGNVETFSITTSGSGYSSAPTTFQFENGTGNQCTGVTFTTTLGKLVTDVTLGSGGGGFTSTPAVSFGGIGQGTADTSPSATAIIGTGGAQAGQVVSITVLSSGSGYTAPTVALSGGTTGTVATASALMASVTTITGITRIHDGSGYLTDPTVTIDGPGGAGTTATAVALIARGPTYGRVFVITTFAETASGARAMSQMEIASPVLGFAVTGALTLNGPEPILEDMPNSMNYLIRGEDENSCGDPVAYDDHPAIGGYDDPDADTNSVQTIINALPRPENYTGAGGTPSVVNVYSSLGETMGTPAGLEALIEAIKAVATEYPANHTLTDNEDGEENDPAIVFVDGDLTYSGNDGVGILLVTGHLRMNGTFSWKGLVLVIGEGSADFDGGGNGLITGSMMIARIYDDDGDLLPTLGAEQCDTDADGDADDSCTVEMDWNGGGGNGIRYDHCWADRMFDNVPFTPPPSTRPLKVLSIRSLP